MFIFCQDLIRQRQRNLILLRAWHNNAMQWSMWLRTELSWVIFNMRQYVMDDHPSQPKGMFYYSCVALVIKTNLWTSILPLSYLYISSWPWMELFQLSLVSWMDTSLPHSWWWLVHCITPDLGSHGYSLLWIHTVPHSLKGLREELWTAIFI